MPKLAAALLSGALVVSWASPSFTVAPLPNLAGTVKFAVIGDNGTGDAAQYEVADQMSRFRQQFPFDLVLMMGDNFYGAQRPSDLIAKFERPYKALLEAGVRFQAALGNHDELDSVNYPPLNMGGQRYYSFVRGNVRFFVLDTNSLDPKQLQWMETALQSSRDEWKIAYFHHPLYSHAGRHGDAIDIRLRLEPLLIQYGVGVVFSGHDHIYERLKPQKGITYFVCGSGGKLRKGDLERSEQTAAGFDQDQAFTLVEVASDELHFETISRAGKTVDTGTIRRNASRAGT
ncbi:MAG: metallophosphoesterase [Vicinamibacterales bacterium]